MTDTAMGARLPALAMAAARLRGPRRWGVAAAAGALATLAMPPLGLWPVLWVCAPALIWLMWEERTARGAFAAGWWFGFAFFLTSLHWIINAIVVFSAALWWFAPLVLVALAAALAVYTGLATLIASRFGHPALAALALPPAWVVLEWLRGMLFTGFPWNLAGHAWTGGPLGGEALSQTAAIGGIYSVSLLAMASAALPALLGLPQMRGRHMAGVAGLAVAIPLLALAHGHARIAMLDGATRAADDAPGLRLAQAAIPQREKWDPALQARNFRQWLDLSARDRPDWVRAIIWPETAASFYLAENDAARAAIADVTPPGGHVLAGTVRRTGPGAPPRNSLLALDDVGEVTAAYDKAHLVPFGEYVPLRGLLPIGRAVVGAVDYAAGPGARTLSAPGLPPFSPLVCYEAIFPGAVADAAQRPAWLLNISNDAWYGDGAGPRQHLAMARIRAVEEGLPMVRAASTGISTVFDALGRPVATLPLGARGTLDARLPPPLEGATPFAWHGHAPVLAAAGGWLATLGFAAVWRRRGGLARGGAVG